MPTATPTMVSIKRRTGCFQACWGLMPATTMTTVMVMPVVMMSFDRPTTVSTAAPIPISTTMPQGRNVKIRRYTKHKDSGGDGPHASKELVVSGCGACCDDDMSHCLIADETADRQHDSIADCVTKA